MGLQAAAVRADPKTWPFGKFGALCGSGMMVRCGTGQLIRAVGQGSRSIIHASVGPPRRLPAVLAATAWRCVRVSREGWCSRPTAARSQQGSAEEEGGGAGRCSLTSLRATFAMHAHECSCRGCGRRLCVACAVGGHVLAHALRGAGHAVVPGAGKYAACGWAFTCASCSTLTARACVCVWCPVAHAGGMHGSTDALAGVASQHTGGLQSGGPIQERYQTGQLQQQQQQQQQHSNHHQVLLPPPASLPELLDPQPLRTPPTGEHLAPCQQHPGFLHSSCTQPHLPSFLPPEHAALQLQGCSSAQGACSLHADRLVPGAANAPWEARVHELLFSKGGCSRSSRLPALPVLEDPDDSEGPAGPLGACDGHVQ